MVQAIASKGSNAKHRIFPQGKTKNLESICVPFSRFLSRISNPEREIRVCLLGEAAVEEFRQTLAALHEHLAKRRAYIQGQLDVEPPQ
jgi:hypothetical protein